jgi:hypothetical protein
VKRRHPKLTRPNGSQYPTPERLVEKMDESGIDKAVVMCSVSPEWRYTMTMPEETLDICAAHPDRLIPFCNVDPRYLTDTADSDFRPMLEAYQEMGAKGVGEYIPNLPFDDPRNLCVFKAVEEVGLPLTFHIAPRIGGCYGCFDEAGLPRLERVLRQFPRLTFLGHSQPFWAEISTNVIRDGHRVGYPEGPVSPGRLVELCRKYPNLHGDLSARSGFNAISRDPDFGDRFMEEFQDRLCWGTDIANDPQDLPIVPYFQRLKAEARISPEAWEKIAWRNADRLLGLGLQST